MDPDTKKTVLRMIPYGLYVLTTESQGRVAASTVNWVTQASFEPPLVAVGVKTGSGAHDLIKESLCFALNVLGKDHKDMAFSFFKPVEREGNSIGGHPFAIGESGAPILLHAAASMECRLVDTLERGDHSIFLGEVVGTGLQREIEGRPDAATLALADLGEKTFYGG